MFRHRESEKICVKINLFIKAISNPVNEILKIIKSTNSKASYEYKSILRSDFIKLYKFVISNMHTITEKETAIIFDILSIIEGTDVFKDQSTNTLCVKLKNSIDKYWKTFTPPITILWLTYFDNIKQTKYLIEARNLFLQLAEAIIFANNVSSREKLDIYNSYKYFLSQNKLDLILDNLNYGRLVAKNNKLVVKIKTKEIVVPVIKEAEVTLKELDALIGLNNVKKEVSELANYLKVQSIRKSHGINIQPMSRHLVFFGNPGTGKTTVARLLARIYKDFGILSKGHFVETDRAGLIGQYIGHTEENVKKMVNEALGGILFIDEAYSLYQGSERDFGIVAIDTLIKLMEDRRNDLVVIVAGYPIKMKKFIESNPGLKSRFNKYFYFNDYSPSELVRIFKQFCLEGHFDISPSALYLLKKIFEILCDLKDETFGNARLVRNIFERTIQNQANRVVVLENIDQKKLNTIEIQDIPSSDQLEEI